MNSQELNKIFLDTIGRGATEEEILEFKDSGMSFIRIKRIILRKNINAQVITKDKPVSKRRRRKRNIETHNQVTQVVSNYTVKNKQWNDLCRDNLDKIRKFFYLEPSTDTTNHAILSIFEESECAEFVLRNMLIKLMGNWKISIVCHSGMVGYINNMIKDISSSIDIIPVSHKKYNKNMLDKTFWKKLVGEKILCMTPETILFNENVDDFLKYDYIGSPWKYKLKGTHVGDGKFSLRTRKKMIDILENFTPSTFLSEDVFFSSTMLKHNIGNLATVENASSFSYKDTKCENTLGGSMIWRSNDGVVEETELLQKVL